MRIVISKQNKGRFLVWFNKIWGGKFSHITSIERKEPEIWLSLNVNDHLLYQIQSCCTEDLKIKCEVK